MANETQEQTIEQARYRLVQELESAAKALFDAHDSALRSATMKIHLNSDIKTALKIVADACKELKTEYGIQKLIQIEEQLKHLLGSEYIRASSVEYEDTLSRVSSNQIIDEDVAEQCGRAVVTCLSMRRLQSQLNSYRKLKVLDEIL